MTIPSVQDIFELAQMKGLALPAWSWPKLKNYNGFTHEERVRGWQAEKLAIRLGVLPDPQTFSCALCNASTFIQYHAEAYDTLERYPLCRSCHCRLHISLGINSRLYVPVKPKPIGTYAKVSKEEKHHHLTMNLLSSQAK